MRIGGHLARATDPTSDPVLAGTEWGSYEAPKYDRQASEVRNLRIRNGLRLCADFHRA